MDPIEEALRELVAGITELAQALASQDQPIPGPQIAEALQALLGPAAGALGRTGGESEGIERMAGRQMGGMGGGMMGGGGGGGGMMGMMGR